MHWADMPGGGHFAAMEKPQLFAQDVTEWAGKVWPTQ
jgi:microsomal epoxide hydrolase